VCQVASYRQSCSSKGAAAAGVDDDAVADGDVAVAADDVDAAVGAAAAAGVDGRTSR